MVFTLFVKNVAIVGLSIRVPQSMCISFGLGLTQRTVVTNGCLISEFYTTIYKIMK